MLDFKEGQYVVGIWFIAYGDKDILATLAQAEKGWVMRWRFLYYVPEPGQKAQSAYTGELPDATEEEALEIAKKSFREMAFGTGGELHELLVQTSDMSVILDRLRKQPWCHTKKIDALVAN